MFLSRLIVDREAHPGGASVWRRAGEPALQSALSGMVAYEALRTTCVGGGEPFQQIGRVEVRQRAPIGAQDS